MINNDSNSLDWALDQKDVKTVENTINLMDKEVLILFISKLIEKFQSVNIIKRNFILWIDCLLKYKFLTILSLPKETQEKLRSMQVLIDSRTKNLEKLIQVKSKLETVLSLFADKGGKKTIKASDSNEVPMLLYNESDSDEEKNKKFNIKLKNNKIKVCEVEKAILNKKKKEVNIINDKIEKEIDDEIQNIEEEDVNIEMKEETEDVVEGDEEEDDYNDFIDEELDENDL